MARLPNIIRGPITLSRIDYAANLSQETTAFTALITIDGKSSVVRNDGGGGPNHIQTHAVEMLVEAHAVSLPPQPSEYGPLDMNADFLVSLMIDDAIKLRDRAKMKKKGFTHEAALDRGLVLYVTATTEADARAGIARSKYAAKAAAAVITQL
jgi:hypothetical protein